MSVSANIVNGCDDVIGMEKYLTVTSDKGKNTIERVFVIGI